MHFIWLHNKKIYNSGYSTEIVNEQCNTGDALETSGGLYLHMWTYVDICGTIFHSISVNADLCTVLSDF